MSFLTFRPPLLKLADIYVNVKDLSVSAEILDGGVLKCEVITEQDAHILKEFVEDMVNGLDPRHKKWSTQQRSEIFN